MDSKMIFFTSYDVILSLVFGLLTIFITLKILDKKILHVDEEHELIVGNVAIAIFAGTITINILMLVQSSIQPSIDTLRTLVLGEQAITFKLVLISFAYFLLYYAICLIFSLIFLFLSIGLYLKITAHFDEITEIKKNNVAVSIMLSMVLIALTLYIRPSVEHFISSLINYEALERRQEQKIENKEKAADKIVPKMEKTIE